MKRTFIYSDAKSNKFWSIKLSADGKSHTVTYGKVGTAGQTLTKDFPSADACAKSAEKLITEKMGKGYVEQATTKASASTAPAKSPKAEAKKEPDPARTATAKPKKPNPALDKKLYNAAIETRADDVRECLEKGADPFAHDTFFVVRNRPTVLKAFLDFGIDINTPDKNGLTILSHAVMKDIPGDITLMLSLGANPSVPALGGKTLLEYAYEKSSFIILTQLLAAGAKPTPSTLLTPLHIAAITGDLDETRKHAQLPGQINAQDAAGCTPLHFAAIADHVAILNLLLDKGADINALTKRSMSSLYAACAMGRANSVAALIGRKANIETLNIGKFTPLLIATHFGQTECASLLLKAGANPNVRNSGGETPLFAAINQANKDKSSAEIEARQTIVQALVEHGADANTATTASGKNSPLMTAIAFSRHAMAACLLKGGANPDYQNEFKSTALHYALSFSDLAMVKLIVEAGADLHLENRDGNTPLKMYASFKKKDQDTIDYLVSKEVERYGSVPKIRGLSAPPKKAPVATSSTHPALNETNFASIATPTPAGEVEKLFRISKHIPYPFDEYADDQVTCVHRGDLHLASITGADQNDQCPYNLVVDGNLIVDETINWKEDSRGSFLFVTGNLKAKNLLLYGAVNCFVRGNIEIENCICGTNGDDGGILLSDGQTSAKLLINQLYFHMKLKKRPNALVISGKSDVNFPVNHDTDELSVLLSADVLDGGGDLDWDNLVGTLLAGSDILRTGEIDGDIFEAAENGNFKLVRELAKAGADVNASGAKKKTVLHLAADRDDAVTIKLLVEKGVNLNPQDNLECTPLFMAAWLRRLKALKELIKAGASLEIPDNHGFTPLTKACTSKSAEVPLLLIKAGADITKKDKYGQNALQLAAESGSLEVVKVLLAKGASLDDQTNKGCTALHWAAEQGHLEIVKLLIASGANPKLKDKEGKTALEFAKGKNRKEVISYLETL